MNQTKQKERENYEPPVVTDIAPVAVGLGGNSGIEDPDEHVGGFS